MASLSASLCHRTPLAAQLLATYVWTGPRATRGADGLERRWRSSSLPRQTPCRGGCLVTPGSLSLTGPCRSTGRAAVSLLSRLGWPSRQAPLAGVLCFKRQSRQAPLAGALCLVLKYFVLEWPKRGPWRVLGVPLASPAAGCYDCP